MKISHSTDVPRNRRRFLTQGIALAAIAGLDPLAGMLHGATTIATGKPVELLLVAGTRGNSFCFAERTVAQHSAPVYIFVSKSPALPLAVWSMTPTRKCESYGREFSGPHGAPTS